MAGEGELHGVFGGDEGDDGAEAEWMDVDGDDMTPQKRVKANSGAVVAKGKREPRSNRQLAGLRDDAVSCILLKVYQCTDPHPSKLQRLSNCGTWANVNGTCSRRLAKVIGLSRSKW